MPVDYELARRYFCRAIYFGNQWSANALRDLNGYIALKGKVSPPAGRPLKTLAAIPHGGPYSEMTYAEYISVLKLRPKKRTVVSSIKPAINYCNGFCFTEISLGELKGKKPASIYWQGNVPPMSIGSFPQDMVLDPGREYKLSIRVWTSMSVGIFTSGKSSGELGTIGSFLVTEALHKERGTIAFEVLGP